MLSACGRLLVGAMACVWLLAGQTAPAYGLPVVPNYLVEIHEGSWEYGVQGVNKVANLPAAFKVSSFYNYSDGHHWVEVGWYKYQGLMTHFTSYWDATEGGPYYSDYTPRPTDGQSYKYSVRLVSKDTDLWRWWIDDECVRSELLHLNPWTGRELASSEVLNSTDNAWTHWWNLKLFDYSSWQAWNGLAEYYDNNPYYHRVKISNTEAYVQTE